MPPRLSPESRLQIVLSSSESEEEETTGEEETSDETAATSSSQGSKREGGISKAATSSSSQETKLEHSTTSQSGFLSDSSSSPTGSRRWRAGHSLRPRDMWQPVVVVSTSSDEVDIDNLSEEDNRSARANNQQMLANGGLRRSKSLDQSKSSLLTLRASARICRKKPQSSSTPQRRRNVAHSKDVKKKCHRSRKGCSKRHKGRSKRPRRDHSKIPRKKQPCFRSRSRKASILAKFSRARTVATHRTTVSWVDQSIRQAVIASHRYARAEEGVMAAQKVVLEARRSTTKGWSSGSLSSTPFSSLTHNVSIPSRSDRPGLRSPPSLTNGAVSSTSSRKQHHKFASDVIQGGSSILLPPHPSARTERTGEKQGGTFPTQDAANLPSKRVPLSTPTLSRSVKTEGISSCTSPPTTPGAATATRKASPVQSPSSTRGKSTKAQVGRDTAGKQTKTSKSLPLKIEQ